MAQGRYQEKNAQQDDHTNHNQVIQGQITKRKMDYRISKIVHENIGSHSDDARFCRSQFSIRNLENTLDSRD
jgi:hypothetical protein